MPTKQPFRDKTSCDSAPLAREVGLVQYKHNKRQAHREGRVSFAKPV